MGGRPVEECLHGYPLTTTSGHRCRAILDGDGRLGEKPDAKHAKKMRVDDTKHNSGSSVSVKHSQADDNDAFHRREVSMDAPMEALTVTSVDTATIIEKDAVVDQRPAHIYSHLDPATSEIPFSPIASGPSDSRAPNNSTIELLPPVSPLHPPHTSHISRDLKNSIERWIYSIEAPPGPDLDLYNFGRLQLHNRFTCVEMVTETAVTVHRAFESMIGLGAPFSTDFAVRDLTRRLILVLALSVGITSRWIKAHMAVPVAQKIVDPSEDVDVDWMVGGGEGEHEMAILVEELETAVERELVRLQAEKEERDRDKEWGHFPGLAGLVKETGVGEFPAVFGGNGWREEGRRDEEGHFPKRDLAMEVDEFFATMQERRGRGET